ncbi:RTA1 like protein-domain-containing protein [Aspergillus pseudoustus]|uniref:RTA1 like protein-domain-containing protein n=1 Tax=Aspergillus pseudoustus TaxID=1810923 RepID=A0ABR4IBK9_9EURO
MYIDLSNLHKRAAPEPEDPDDWSLYFYNPSLAAAVVFAAAYLIPFFYHLYISYVAYRNDKYFRFSYSVPLLIAAVAEVNGYGQRAGSTQDHQDISLFSTSQTMIVLAPVFVCASLYILLSRIIRAAQPEGINEKELRVLNGWIKVTWLPKIFVTLDILSMLTQGGGSGIAASGEWEGTLLDTGIGVLIGGLALQLATFAVFLIVVIKFHIASIRRGPKLEHEMLMVIRGIYIAGFFIMIRSIFRLIEFAWGTESYIMTHEWPIYVLEAVPMLIAFMVLGWYHPSRWLPASLAGESRGRAWLLNHRTRNLPEDVREGERSRRRKERHGHQNLPSV